MIRSLTKSENEVVKLKGLGFLIREIASIRGNSESTIKGHLCNAMRKTDTKTSHELVVLYSIRDHEFSRILRRMRRKRLAKQII